MLQGPYRILTREWVMMAEAIERMGKISEAERKMPKKSDDATLWECEELVLRFMLEDGKLNLILRNLVDLKDFQREVQRGGKGVTDREQAAVSRLDPSMPFASERK